MAFKRRTTTAVAKPVEAPDVIHMVKQTLTKSGGPPMVEVMCGEQGLAYRGKGRPGLKTTVWNKDVTCPECKKCPSIALWYEIHGDDAA